MTIRQYGGAPDHLAEQGGTERKSPPPKNADNPRPVSQWCWSTAPAYDEGGGGQRGGDDHEPSQSLARAQPQPTLTNRRFQCSSPEIPQFHPVATRPTSPARRRKSRVRQMPSGQNSAMKLQTTRKTHDPHHQRVTMGEQAYRPQGSSGARPASPRIERAKAAPATGRCVLTARGNPSEGIDTASIIWLQAPLRGTPQTLQRGPRGRLYRTSGSRNSSSQRPWIAIAV